jgi:hypothetical protein
MLLNGEEESKEIFSEKSLSPIFPASTASPSISPHPERKNSNVNRPKKIDEVKLPRVDSSLPTFFSQQQELRGILFDNYFLHRMTKH